MWLNDLPAGDSWMGIWKNKFTCGSCRGIISDLKCPLCGYDQNVRTIPEYKLPDGSSMKVPSLQLMGAFEWSTHVLLRLMQREWERPIVEEDDSHNSKIP